MSRTISYAQSKYLNTLAQECRARGIELPEKIKDELRDMHKMTMQRATVLIGALKFELGW